MIVVDASVLVAALVFQDDRGAAARLQLGRDVVWAAPDHWKVEVFSAVRGLFLGGKVRAHRAAVAMEQLCDLGVDSVPIDGLLPRMWDLRSAISGYDAAYVALAEARDVALVTVDARLARAARSYCRVVVAT